MSGRGSFKRVAAVGLAAAAVLALSSCSSEASGGGVVDPDGILRVGYPLGSMGTHLDPAASSVNVDIAWMGPVYGTLLRKQADGSLDPWMAESVEIMDPKTVKISLREGVTFTDGTSYDAEAVKINLLRTMNPATPQAVAAQSPVMRTIDDVEVVDTTTALVHLTQPLAGQMLVELAQRGGLLVSPKQIAEDPGEINTKPVGAGPFTIVSYAADRSIVYAKNPDFWDADNVKIGGVEYVATPYGPQQANGLLAGSIDFAYSVMFDSIKTLESSGFATHAIAGPVVNLVMCTSKPPFDNEDVRKAVQIGIDRQKFADMAFGGAVNPATSFIADESAQFNPATEGLTAYDPERAEKLLADSGVINPSFELHYPAVVASLASATEALQQQLKNIGFEVSIIADRDIRSSWMDPQGAGMMLTPTVGTIGLDNFNLNFAPGGVYALCGVDRPDVMAFVDQANALDPADPAAIEAVRKAQELMAENAYAIPLTTYPVVPSWNEDHVGGDLKFTADGYLQLDSAQVMK